MDPAIRKKELRRKCLRERNALSDDDWLNMSEQIREHVLASEVYYSAEVVHCYISMNERKEVDTHTLIEYMLEDNKRVMVPVTDFTTNILHHVEITSIKDLSPNKWGVLEPDISKKAGADVPDLILVPLLAADRKGNRLGYGKGFYDKFLEKAEAGAYGLIFDQFIQKEVPTEPFDQLLNGLFSEKGLLHT